MVEQMVSNNTLFVHTVTVYKALSFTLFQLNSIRRLMVIFVFSNLFSSKAGKGTNFMFTLVFNGFYFYECELQ